MIDTRAGMTAAELLTQLAGDPDYKAMRADKDRERSRFGELRRKEQEPLLNDLTAAGVVVDWIGRLLELPAPDRRIYPVLLDHLAKPYSAWLLEWIGRAFGHKTARAAAWDALINRLERHTLQEGATEGVLAAISAMAQPGDLPTLIRLLADRSLGPGRIYLVSNLMRSKRVEARVALVQCRTDPDLSKEINARLSKAERKVR